MKSVGYLLVIFGQLLIGPGAIAAGSIAAPQTIVLISIDTLRADRLSCYGYGQETTPHIDALAKESLFFENPFSPVPMTLPSHSSMFTGLIPPTHGVHVNTEYSLPASAVTLPELLKAQGYTTYGNVSAVVLDAKRGLKQGFDTYDDSIEGGNGDIPLSAHPFAMRNGKETTDRALAWLDDNAEKKKFMFIHYFDPHAVYNAPPPYDTRFKDPYDAEIAFTDHCVGRILNRLKALGLYDDALIAFVGDHGEMLGEHGEDYHSFFIYKNVLRVPMMYKLPGGVAAKRVAEPCSLIDVAPTLLSLAGVEPPEAMQGIDLSSYLDADFAQPDRAIYAESMVPTTFNCSSLLGLIQGRWHYIQSTRPELYDWLEDPEELNNLLTQHPEQADKMKEQLRQMLAESEPLEAETSSGLDAAALEQLESLGYIGGKVTVDYSFEKGEEDAKDMMAVANKVHEALKIAEAGNGDLAIKICTDVIRQYPKASEAYKKLVSIHVELDALEEALAVLDEMRVRFPEDWLVLRYRAHILIQHEDYPRALAALNEFIALKDDDAIAYQMFVDIYTKQKAFDKVLATLQTKRSFFPDDPDVLIALGDAYEQIKDLPNAVSSYLGALALNPNSNRTRIGVGHLYFKMQDLEQALFYFEQALERDTSLASIHGMVALIEVDVTNPRVYDPLSALGHAKFAFQLSKDEETGQCSSPIAYETLAFAWAANGGLDQAIYAAERAVELYTSMELSTQVEKMKQRLVEYRRRGGAAGDVR